MSKPVDISETPDRDIVGRRIMELQDQNREVRLKLLTYLLDQVKAGELSRFEAVRAFKQGTLVTHQVALNYIISMGSISESERHIWESQLESL